jgi:transposase
MCQAMITREYLYAYAAVSIEDGQLDSLILPTVNGDCMQVFLDEVVRRYPQDRIVMVLDGAGWHKSRELKLPANLRLVRLPPYAPELNPVEHVWDDLREKHFHNRVFHSLDAVQTQLAQGLIQLESDPAHVKSIVGWPWILDALKN